MIEPRMPARSWRGVGFLPFLAAMALGGGCRPAGAGPAMVGTAPSAEVLARRVLDALARADAEDLAALRVSREEYETLLWPEMPESDRVPFEFVWSLLDANSRKAARIALERFGGQRVEYVGLDFTKEPEAYPGYTLYRGARLTVRRPSDGAEGAIRLLDVIVERQRRWKLLDYEE